MIKSLVNTTHRRHILDIFALLTLTALLLSASRTTAATQDETLPPTASQLQSGDLIWPKEPRAIVPFNSQPGEADNDQELRWQEQKEAYLDGLREMQDPSESDKRLYSVLQTMTYEDFAAQYLDDRIPGEPAPFGVGSFYVGHVGIVEVVDGEPTIIEAVLGTGVRRISYAEWLHERQGELVWLARLKDVPPDIRTAVAEAASDQIGKPYNFWNFDLLDTRSFYCSKLAWYAIVTGAGFSPDDDPDPNRAFWYSPKRLMRSRHIELLANPGSYGHSN